MFSFFVLFIIWMAKRRSEHRVRCVIRLVGFEVGTEEVEEEEEDDEEEKKRTKPAKIHHQQQKLMSYEMWRRIKKLFYIFFVSINTTTTTTAIPNIKILRSANVAWMNHNVHYHELTTNRLIHFISFHSLLSILPFSLTDFRLWTLFDLFFLVFTK